MDKKKSIVLILLIIAIIAITVIVVNGRKTGDINETIKNTTEGKNTITKEEMEESIKGTVEEKLKQSGLVLEEKGKTRGKIGTEGTSYIVYLKGEERQEENKIEVYKLDGESRRRLGKDAEDGEITLEGEKYWKKGTILIKLSNNEQVNQIIKDTIK